MLLDPTEDGLRKVMGAQTMKKATHAMLALALLGLAVAFYDSYAIYHGQALWCPPPINGCNEVANSPYARIFDLPVGYFGVAYYLYMFCLAALLAFDPFSRAHCVSVRSPTPAWAFASQSISCTSNSASSTRFAFTASCLRSRPYLCSLRRSRISQRRRSIP
jgi:hypothetical protein